MPIELTPDVKVRRDPNGIVRQLSHAQHPYRPAAFEMVTMAPGSLTPRSLAETYLRDAAPIFGFAAGETANFAASASPAPTEAGVELRFKEEKAVGDGVTVSYDQTVHGLPIWDAGVAVRIDKRAMGVTGSHNATHDAVEARRPRPDAEYLPHRMDPSKVLTILGLGADAPLKIHATRALVYRYLESERFDPQIEAHRRNATSRPGVAGKAFR